MMMKTRNLSAPFPLDIMIDILHRLPLKTLLTCKLVSNQWKDLIDDPVFYKRHTNSRTAIVLGHDATLSLLFLDEDLEMHRVPIDMSTSYSRSAQLLNSGSPNETMACLVSLDGIFFLYNLFTGAAFVVGSAPMRHYSYNWICYGFGYDSHADDHKIFVACKNYAVEKYSGFQNNLFWVYSFSNKVWERLKGFFDCATLDMICHQRTGHSFNGVLHWVFGRIGADPWSEQREEVIVTYDLHTSRFGEMPVPKKAYRVAIILGRYGKVSQLNGLLCYSYTDWEYGVHFRQVVWVMNEYGVEDSWQKLFSIDSKSLDREIKESLYLRERAEPAVLHESEEGRIAVLFVCHDSGRMFWYGLKEGEFGEIDEDPLLKETRRLNLA